MIKLRNPVALNTVTGWVDARLRMAKLCGLLVVWLPARSLGPTGSQQTDCLAKQPGYFELLNFIFSKYLFEKSVNTKLKGK